MLWTLHILSISKIMSLVRCRLIHTWQAQWSIHSSGRHFYSINSTINQKPFFLGSTRFKQRIINRLRLGHAHLNYYPFIIGKHPSSYCACGQNMQTVAHYLLICPLYVIAWKDFFNELSKHDLQSNLKDILSSQCIDHQLLTFVAASGKLHSWYCQLKFKFRIIYFSSFPFI